MPDYGSIVADKAISQTARKIRDVYKQAALEIRRKMDDFTKRHIKKSAEMLEKVKSGEITQTSYDLWMKGQVFIGKQWDQKLDQTMKILDSANRQAKAVVDTKKLDVFAENYNHAVYELEKQAGALSFNIYNEETVGKLIKENPKMLPEWKINERKDYAWNRQKVENSITQGIIQGEDVDQITERLVESLCTQNENRMRTFARTAITGAQNAGRQAQMEDAEDMGIKVKKRWLATLDDRTRDTHQELDGQEVDIDEPFTVDLDGKTEEIRYPGDPNAEPCLVYNCRCTMIQVYPGIDRKSVRRDMDDNKVENMTYKEWKEWKENDGKVFTGMEGQDNIISGGVSGAKKTEGWEDRHAERYYEEVRNRKDYADALNIVKNENVPLTVEEVEAVRHHVFIDKHQLETGYERFAPDKYQSDAWQRLVARQGTDEDVVFLQHEKEEHDLMEQGLSQREAHEKADEKYNWWALVKKRLKVDE